MHDASWNEPDFWLPQVCEMPEVRQRHPHTMQKCSSSATAKTSHSGRKKFKRCATEKGRQPQSINPYVDYVDGDNHLDLDAGPCRVRNEPGEIHGKNEEDEECEENEENQENQEKVAFETETAEHCVKSLIAQHMMRKGIRHDMCNAFFDSVESGATSFEDITRGPMSRIFEDEEVRGQLAEYLRECETVTLGNASPGSGACTGHSYGERSRSRDSRDRDSRSRRRLEYQVSPWHQHRGAPGITGPRRRPEDQHWYDLPWHRAHRISKLLTQKLRYDRQRLHFDGEGYALVQDIIDLSRMHFTEAEVSFVVSRSHKHGVPRFETKFERRGQLLIRLFGGSCR